MLVLVKDTKQEMAAAAADRAAVGLNEAIEQRGAAYLVLATGASQLEFLDELVQREVDWSAVETWHLDEYLGMRIAHPASFRKYLKERFHERVPLLRFFHYINGDAYDAGSECARIGGLIRRRTIDVACVGIGENGHLAFNDPPADFETDDPYLVVTLDEACRRQQLGEGWFETLDDVPTQAISMSVREILRARKIVCTVPDERKARAVKAAVDGPVTPEVPASILQQHSDVALFLDAEAASKLKR